jgi:hypothetical protein
MARRPRADSTAAALKVVAHARKEIAPPSHVRMGDEDWPYWHSVVAEFARSEWTDHHLEVAGFLARTMADLEREQWELRREGSVMASERGTPVVNPRKSIVQMHAGTILSLRRSLSLHARAQGGEARDIGKRRDAEHGIEAAAQRGEASGLLN